VAKPTCTATSKQTGKRCGAYPPPGSAVCRYHGGLAPQVRAAAVRRLQAEEARADLVRLGVSIETTPVEALQAMLDEAAGNVAVLRSMVHELSPDEWYGPKFGPGMKHRAQGDAGVIPVESTWPAENTQLPHVLVVMYGEERDRFTRLARDCAGLDLDARRTAVAEASATRLFGAIGRAFDRAGLDHDQVAAVKLALANELRAA
jgi:hypothetical protein